MSTIQIWSVLADDQTELSFHFHLITQAEIVFTSAKT